jgi:hypothetical protein
MQDQPKIVWIASYPKSGNTWLRFMLLHVLLGKQTSTKNMDRIIQDIHVLMPKNIPPKRLDFPMGSPALFKTHFMLWPEMPFRHLTAGFIYVLRNPLDVVASAAHYHLLKKPLAAEANEGREARARVVQHFISRGAAPDWIEAYWGSWDQHVRSWVLDRPSYPSVVVRYEDMIREPLAQLRRVTDFLGLRCEPQRLQAAVEASSFDNMKAIEDREIRAGTPGFFTRESTVESLDAGYRFMSRGNPGGHKIALTDTERAQLLERFGPTMEQIGYPVHA